MIDRYRIGYVVAVEWNPDMAARFPNADHNGCRQELWHDGHHWKRHQPAKCHGYHCNRCGAATGMYGHTNCPDSVEGLGL